MYVTELLQERQTEHQRKLGHSAVTSRLTTPYSKPVPASSAELHTKHRIAVDSSTKVSVVVAAEFSTDDAKCRTRGGRRLLSLRGNNLRARGVIIGRGSKGEPRILHWERP